MERGKRKGGFRGGPPGGGERGFWGNRWGGLVSAITLLPRSDAVLDGTGGPKTLILVPPFRQFQAQRRDSCWDSLRRMAQDYRHCCAISRKFTTRGNIDGARKPLYHKASSGPCYKHFYLASLRQWFSCRRGSHFHLTARRAHGGRASWFRTDDETRLGAS